MPPTHPVLSGLARQNCEYFWKDEAKGLFFGPKPFRVWGMRSYEKVFGIGLNKTGTTSLKLAFERLGFDHLERQPRLFKRWKQGRISDVIAATKDHETFEDWPWPLMIRELLDHYGARARFVLTTRVNADVWVASLKAHAERTNPHRNPRRDIFGIAYPHGVEDRFAAFYEDHLRDVRALFADCPHLLREMCWEDGHGWTELCEFLDCPVPQEPFPRANRAVDAAPNPEFLRENKALIAAQLERLKLGAQGGGH